MLSEQDRARKNMGTQGRGGLVFKSVYHRLINLIETNNSFSEGSAEKQPCRRDGE